MNEDIQDESSTVNHVMQRSPTFSKQEIKTLIQLIESHKSIILNKSTNSTTNHAKEVAWAKIAKSFNSEGFKNVRSSENLRTKWENIKKEARKLSKNLINIEYNEYNHLLSQVVLMMNETDKVSAMDVPEVDAEFHEPENESTKTKFWDEDDKLSNQSNDGNNESENCLKINRSLNFSPQECSLLLRCVKSEKQHVFSKKNTGRAVKLKNNAWSKITCSFNKINPQKRTTKALRTKFNNMKKLAKNANVRERFFNGHKKLEEENDSKNIKTEPMFEYAIDNESSSEISDNGNEVNDEYQDAPDVEIEHPDPLSTILNGDSGIDSINNFGCLNQTQDKEIGKLKLELLKYQLETAKIERQRIQERTESERSERESRAIEMSLRLRTARLELVAAESKLPASHPALQHHHTETRARDYMQQFTDT